ncbi:hypothetical protein [Dyadobacter sp. CY312]|uniref:hypothetical protein n=1 Tax=Dyadobacter sp. CY312 TaxID=2907303 RepID=UPI001F17F35D|nr:hypothetical protein [Dyadobacter sp. CY312]MCE7040359.1 hypothetical protein [Dyadobacter sp. CY312]
MRRIIHALALILIPWVSSCDVERKKDDSLIVNMDSRAKVDSSVFVVLPYKNQRWIFENASSTDLNHRDLLLIEAALRNSVNLFNQQEEKRFYEVSRKNPDIDFDKWNFLIDLSRYKRQYIAVATNKGDKEVWIYCLSDNAIENMKRMNVLKDWDWRKSYMQFNDGGNNFFTVRINLTSGKLYYFMTNGSETINSYSK